MKITQMEVYVYDADNTHLATFNCVVPFNWEKRKGYAEWKTLANAVCHAAQNLEWQEEDEFEDYWRAINRAFAEGSPLDYERNSYGAILLVEDQDGWSYRACIDIEQEQ